MTTSHPSPLPNQLQVPPFINLDLKFFIKEIIFIKLIVFRPVYLMWNTKSRYKRRQEWRSIEVQLAYIRIFFLSTTTTYLQTSALNYYQKELQIEFNKKIVCFKMRGMEERRGEKLIFFITHKQLIHGKCREMMMNIFMSVKSTRKKVLGINFPEKWKFALTTRWKSAKNS